jgi:hypothetical protein
MILTLLALLFLKHYLVDFVFQTQQEIDNKGIYLDWRGIKHSLKHAVGTMLIFAFTSVAWIGVLILGIMDFVLHYHIDYVKMNYGTRDVATKRFWNELGADQLAHYLTYLLLIWMTI